MFWCVVVLLNCFSCFCLFVTVCGAMVLLYVGLMLVFVELLVVLVLLLVACVRGYCLVLGYC